eukprot:884068-Prymnesium_polylepis.1
MKMCSPSPGDGYSKYDFSLYANSFFMARMGGLAAQSPLSPVVPLSFDFQHTFRYFGDAIAFLFPPDSKMECRDFCLKLSLSRVDKNRCMSAPAPSKTAMPLTPQPVPTGYASRRLLPDCCWMLLRRPSRIQLIQIVIRLYS